MGEEHIGVTGLLQTCYFDLSEVATLARSLGPYAPESTCCDIELRDPCDRS